MTPRRGPERQSAGRFHATRASHHGVTAPIGFYASACSAGIKLRNARPDVTLVVSDRPAASAGVFTTNLVRAAPVVWSQRAVRRGGHARAILINSGNANACTGREGHLAVRQSAAAAASAIGCGAREILIGSTGVIGVRLPVERLLAVLPRLARGLARAPRASMAAARAILTTDTRSKLHAVNVRAGGRTYTVGGMAKGAGMIHPNMATMLSVLTTDAPLSPAQARRLLRGAVDCTFNAVTVDGDTSTNDCALLLANGAAGGRVAPRSRLERAIASAVTEVCAVLAEKIAADGEGARKLLVVRVTGARSVHQARTVARVVASSPLVKTAVHGGDPNWGRVFAAAGRSGVPLNASRLDLRIGGHWVALGGAVHPEGERCAARHLRGRRVEMELRLGLGAAEAFALGCDLSADYVAINAHYRS